MDMRKNNDAVTVATKSKTGVKFGPGGRGEVADEILEVAFDLFSKKDYSDVSMKEIAKQAGTSYSLVYYYYANKEEIFHSSVQYAIIKAETTYKRYITKKLDPVELINRWLDINIKLSGPLKRLCKIMLEHSDRKAGSPPTVEKNIRYFYKFERGLLSNSISQGVDAGLFKCSDPDELAAFISTGIDGIYYGALTRPGFSIKKSIEILRRNIWVLLAYRGALPTAGTATRSAKG